MNLNKPPKKSKVLGIVSLIFGGMSFIPLIGVLAGIVAIILGFIDLFKNKSKLGFIAVIIGLLGILFTFAIYGSLYYFGFVQRGGVYDELKTEMVKNTLPQTINAIEAYKIRYGVYPQNIMDLSVIYPNQPYLYLDPVASQFAKKQISYFYLNFKNSYYLFSVGMDGQPFTNDDIFPLIEGQIGNLGYRNP